MNSSVKFGSPANSSPDPYCTLLSESRVALKSFTPHTCALLLPERDLRDFWKLRENLRWRRKGHFRIWSRRLMFSRLMASITLNQVSRRVALLEDFGLISISHLVSGAFICFHSEWRRSHKEFIILFLLLGKSLSRSFPYYQSGPSYIYISHILCIIAMELIFTFKVGIVCSATLVYTFSKSIEQTMSIDWSNFKKG